MKAQISATSPLRQRMIDDMRMRKLAPKTQQHYVRAVRRFAVFLGRLPDTASREDLRRYQLYLVDQGTSPVSLNAAITGLKFFFDVTVDHPELMAKIRPVRVPDTLHWRPCNSARPWARHGRPWKLPTSSVATVRPGSRRNA